MWCMVDTLLFRVSGSKNGVGASYITVGTPTRPQIECGLRGVCMSSSGTSKLVHAVVARIRDYKNRTP